MHFDVRYPGNKSSRDRRLIKLPKSPSLMVSASSASKKSFPKTLFLSENADELCDRLKLLLQEKQAGNISDIINDEIVYIVDNLSE